MSLPYRSKNLSGKSVCLSSLEPPPQALRSQVTEAACGRKKNPSNDRLSRIHQALSAGCYPNTIELGVGLFVLRDDVEEKKGI